MATNRVVFNRLQQAAGHGGGAYTSSKQNHMLAAMYIVYRWILRRRYRSRNKPHLSLRAMSSIYDLPPYDQAVVHLRFNSPGYCGIHTAMCGIQTFAAVFGLVPVWLSSGSAKHRVNMLRKAG